MIHPFVQPWRLNSQSLATSLLLLSVTFGTIILSLIFVLALLQMAMLFGELIATTLSILLLGWAGIEALAACERWLEREAHFQR